MNKALKYVIPVLVVLALAAGVWYVIENKKSPATSEYQAVFLSNGQVYFGKMSRSRQWLTLTDVYYLQSQTQSPAGTDPNATPAATASPSEIKLVKLGSELHGPEDQMFLDTKNILFWENLKPDSKVVQAIKQRK